jgi:hypothetical protein
MQRTAEADGLEVLNPEHGTKPRIWYKNLWRYSTAFIGGSVSMEKDGLIDCVEGAKVTLSKDGATVAEATTDIYGDFKFDQLPENSGAYAVKIAAEGHPDKSVDVTLEESIYLREIRV